MCLHGVQTTIISCLNSCNFPLRDLPASVLTSLLPVHLPYMSQSHLSLSQTGACHLPSARSYLKPFSNSFLLHQPASQSLQGLTLTGHVLIMLLPLSPITDSTLTGLQHLPSFSQHLALTHILSSTWVWQVPVHPGGLWFKCQLFIVT